MWRIWSGSSSTMILMNCRIYSWRRYDCFYGRISLRRCLGSRLFWKSRKRSFRLSLISGPMISLMLKFHFRTKTKSSKPPPKCPSSKAPTASQLPNPPPWPPPYPQTPLRNSPPQLHPPPTQVSWAQTYQSARQYQKSAKTKAGCTR
jgi:hypothetical protein